MLLTFFVFILNLFLVAENALAQGVISFTNPDNVFAGHNFEITYGSNISNAANNTTSYAINSSGAIPTYKVTLYRRPNFTDEAYVRICSGTSSNPLAHTLSNDAFSAQTGSPNNTTGRTWVSSGTVFKQELTGGFDNAKNS